LISGVLPIASSVLERMFMRAPLRLRNRARKPRC
jgi:hypothetical protein